MSHGNSNKNPVAVRMLSLLALAATCWLGTVSQAATPGVTGPAFQLAAGPMSSSQPDGQQVYGWGYGCSVAPAGFAPFPGNCPASQVPGPTLIVTEGQTVSVTLTNSLPTGAGNTSILFPGFQVSASGGVAGLRTQEAAPGGTVTYTFVASTPGTHAYYSGTQPDLQIELGLYGAVVVLPNAPPATCTAVSSSAPGGPTDDYRLASAAYDHAATCYDREYLFQFAEMDSRIHRQVEEQLATIKSCVASSTAPCPTGLNVVTEPYRANYFLVNGRSMPDDMDANYAPNYPSQPYNGNPHMHPGEQVLLRVIGQGHYGHPFHEHANHVRILGRDGNLLLSQTDPNKLAGMMMFTTDTWPGQAFDGIFYYTARGLNWDLYGHSAANAGNPACVPDANGYYTTTSPTSPPVQHPTYTGTTLTGGPANYFEWCADHNHPLETKPVGQVGSGGPVTLPDPLILTNGLWYNGTPYLGPDAVTRSRGPTPLPPGGALQNPPAEAGIAFMWHSHNEREITTNDVFPGGMLMMMLVDPWVWYIDETL